MALSYNFIFDTQQDSENKDNPLNKTLLEKLLKKSSTFYEIQMLISHVLCNGSDGSSVRSLITYL
jgi:hypothetical protein